MSWFDTAGIASFAKSALNTAQKTIDKALDIQEEKEIKNDNTSKLPGLFDFFFSYYSYFITAIIYVDDSPFYLICDTYKELKIYDY